MSKTGKIVRNVTLGLAALGMAVIVASAIVGRTQWFRNYIRHEIVSATEQGTGGRVEIGWFGFDESNLTATVTNFVIHGTEPAGARPFVRIGFMKLKLRLFTRVRTIYEITSLEVDKPQVNVIVLANGKTNIPVPKQKANPDESPLKTVVDLAVGHFELTNGLLALDSRKQPMTLRGNNLRVQLAYNLLNRSYRGQLSLQPFYVASGQNMPVNLQVTLPVTLREDRIELQNGSISTTASTIAISGSMDDMRNPKVSVKLNGHVALAELAASGGIPLDMKALNAPAVIDLSADAMASADSIRISELHATLGHSNIEASGVLKDAAANGSLGFRSQISMSELGALLKVSARPSGNLILNGTARLGSGGAYSATGEIQAKNLSFQQEGRRISNVGLYSHVRADQQTLDLNDLRVDAFGGEFAGNVSLANFARFKLDGNLKHLGIRSALQALGEKLPYDGAVSGPVTASGDMKAPGTRSFTAQARLSIAPGKAGIPVSGRLKASYNGDTDNAEIENSWIALPHTRLNVNGALSKSLSVALTTTDLNDLLAAAPMPVALSRGQAGFNGTVTGSLSSPKVAGHLAANRFAVEGRQFDSLAVDVAASGSGATVRNGELNRAAMSATFTASTGLKDWKSLLREPISADVSVSNGDLADLVVLAGEPATGYSGALNATAHIDGSVGNPRGTARVQAANGTIAGEAFDQAQVQINLADQLVTIPAAYVQSGSGRVDLNAEFRHPRDSFTTGSLNARVQSNQIDLASIRTIQSRMPAAGVVRINATVKGDLSGWSKNLGNDFLLTSVNADLSARGLRFEGQSYGDFNATAATNAQTVSYNVTSNFAGSNIHATGNTKLNRDYPTTAAANISNLPIERVLVVARHTDIPARGILSGTANVSGTVSNPQGSADMNLTRAVLRDEPIDRLHVRATWLEQSIDISQLEAAEGPSRIQLTAHYDHPAGNISQGRGQFDIESSRIDLGRIHNVQNLRPGLGGIFQIAARGAGTVREGAQPIVISDLKADVAASGLTAEGRNFGDVKLKVDTGASGRLDFALDSNLAGASIQGRGNAGLTDGYPVSAQVTFKDVLYTHLRELMGKSSGEASGFEAALDGQVSVNGPVMDATQLRGDIQLTHVNVTTIPGHRPQKPITIANQGPIAITLDRGVVRILNAHMTGAGTDIQAAGTTSLDTRTMNLTVNAKADLGILPNFDPDIYAAGNLAVAAAVRGSASDPLVNGQLTFQKASFNYAGISNGISNANGAVALNGNSASVENLTAESGGGKITMTGFVRYGGAARFGLRAKASNVRVQVQEGLSVLAGADIQLTGTVQRSVISGDALVERVTYNPRTDMGTLLARAAPPVQSPEVPSPLLENMKLDVKVRTASSLAVEASMAENLQADADLHIRGTAAEPGVTGRVTISQGQLVFFGSNYSVSTGTIGFYNPLRIDPILDMGLKTQAKGVDVALRITGPVDNMKLSYSSNPPLQFQEIISLLAAGKAPTSDPTLLANQPQLPQQSFQQMGESAIIGQTLANPVSGRLQRVFGVSQLKIDPSFQAGSSTPTARLTLQQRITGNLTFTYTSALDDPNGQIVKVEWALNPQWSAVATRDQNGIFSLNFAYMRQFR